MPDDIADAVQHLEDAEANIRLLNEGVVAAYDANNIWHNPGDGQFAKPGWSTAKGEALRLVKGLLARDLAKEHPDESVLLHPDGDSLEGIGVAKGSVVKVRYVDDQFGSVDVHGPKSVHPTKVRWDRFADPDPTLSSPVATAKMPDIPAINGNEPLVRLDEITGGDSVTPHPGDIDLRNHDFTNDTLEGIDLSGTNMSGVDLHGRSVQKSKLWSTDLDKTDLSGAVFDGSILQSATLTRVKADGASFHEADLAYATFAHSDAPRTNFTGARFLGTDFGHTDLSGSNFGDADLTRAELAGANLSGVDLSEAKLNPAKMVGAKYDSETKFPKGFDRSGMEDVTAAPSMFDTTDLTVPDKTPPKPVAKPEPSLFDTTDLATGKVKPTLPADYDAKLMAKRLGGGDTPAPTREVDSGLHAGPGTDPTVRVPWANHVPDGTVTVEFPSGGTDMDSHNRAQKAIRDAGYDPSLVRQRGLGEDKTDTSIARVEITAKPDAGRITAFKDIHEAEPQRRERGDTVDLIGGDLHLQRTSKAWMLYSDSNGLVVPDVPADRIAQIRDAIHELPGSATIADVAQAAQAEIDAPAVPAKPDALTTFRGKEYTVRPDGTVLTADGGRVGDAMAAKIREAAGTNTLMDNIGPDSWTTHGIYTKGDSIIPDSTPSADIDADVPVPPAEAAKIDNAVEAEMTDALESDLSAPIESPPEPEDLPKGKFPPTPEQLIVLEAARTGDSLVVKAGAGAGKTSTVVLVAEQAKTQGRSGVFTAFNKAIVTDAGSRLPNNVNAATMHALANRAMRSARPELMKRLNSKAMSRNAEAQLLGINAPVKTSDKTLRPGWLAGWVMKAVEQFAMSADTAPSWEHFEPIRGLSDGDNEAVAKAHLPALEAAWKDLTSDTGKLRFGHSTYLKLFQLSDPNLGTDFVLFDEAQDASPVMASIITQQQKFGTQLIFVGDADQSINGFMGAVDALSDLEKTPGVKSTALTNSFRFGPEIAEIANNVLANFSGARIVGAGKPSSVGIVANPDAILTRTNGTAMQFAVEAIDEGKTVAMSDNLVKALTGFAKAAKSLKEDGWTDHADLAPFATWGAVQDYVENDPAGGDIKTLVDLVDNHGADSLIDTLAHMKSPGDADLTVLTAHTSKGLEFDTVRLADDFPVDQSKMNVDDYRLMYVALTRAKKKLDVGANSWILEPPARPTEPTVTPIPVDRPNIPDEIPLVPLPDVPDAPKVDTPDAPSVDTTPIGDAPSKYTSFAKRFPQSLKDSDVEADPTLRPFALEALHTVAPGMDKPSDYIQEMSAKYPPGTDKELSLKQSRAVLNWLRPEIAANAARLDGIVDTVTPDKIPTATPVNDTPDIPDVPAPTGRGAKWSPAQIRAALRRINSSMEALEIINGKPVIATTGKPLGDGRAEVSRQPGVIDSHGVFHSAGPVEKLTMKPKFGGAPGLAKWYAKQWDGGGVEQYDLDNPTKTAALPDGEDDPVDADQFEQTPAGAFLIDERRPGTTSATVHTAALVTDDLAPFQRNSDAQAVLLIDDEPVATWVAGVTPTVDDVADVVDHQGWRLVAGESANGDGYDNRFSIDPLPPVDRCRVAAMAGVKGQWLVARDNYLSRIGVHAGSAVKVQHQDDEHGVVDVEVDGDLRSYPVKWDRFGPEAPAPDTPLVTSPKYLGNTTKATTGAGSVTEQRVRETGSGHAVVADNYLNRYGVTAGAVVPVTWIDENTAILAAPNGQTVRAAWSRFADADPTAVTLDHMDIVSGTEFDNIAVGTRFAVEALGATVTTPDGRVAALVKSSDAGYTIAGEPAVEHEWVSSIAPHLRLLVEKDN